MANHEPTNRIPAASWPLGLLGALLLGPAALHCRPEPGASPPLAAADAAAPVDATPPPDALGPFDPPRPANNRDYQPLALAAIEAASERVHVIEYVIYPGGAITPLLDALSAASGRGVDVAVLADETASQTTDALAALATAGVEVRQDSPTTTTHNKLIIADDVTLVGSHNFSHNAMEYNNEASMQISDPRVADYYDSYFQALWLDSDANPVLTKPDSAPVTPIHNGEIVSRLEQCIQGSTSRIRVLLYALCYRLEYPDSDSNRLLERLIEAHEAGVDVTVVLDQSDWIVENGINDEAIAQLAAAGVDLRHPPANEVTHAKMLLCDDTVIVSDANWCYSALTLYNGTSAEVTSTELAEQYETWFQSIWSYSSEASPE